MSSGKAGSETRRWRSRFNSTGAIAGNILGALTGYEKIDDKWKKDLELTDVILTVADALADVGMNKF